VPSEFVITVVFGSFFFGFLGIAAMGVFSGSVFVSFSFFEAVVFVELATVGTTSANDDCLAAWSRVMRARRSWVPFWFESE
jgi:formate hydrogenlyase subunit 3/multisubunit Na+/H+ antiporter MnhD subunit